MSFDLGDVVPLSVTIRDADGHLADATTVTLTVTLPDGTTDVTTPVTSTTVGVYNHDYEAVQAGRHGVRWVATGTNTSAYTDAFLVEPADPNDFISLRELKRHMDRSEDDTSDDAEMAGFVTAACRMVVERIGRVSPVIVVEDVRARRRIVLKEHPVVSVASVETLPGLEVVTDWTLDGGAGLIEGTRSFGNVRVTYRAGRTPVPGNVRLATLELASHLWRSSQLNSGGVRPLIADNDAPVMPGSAYALPIRVRELLGLGANPTSDILVG